MQSPKVSIIIPVYNGADFVAEAIESALGQTYKNTEIIAINDGSTDEGRTDLELDRFRDQITILRKQNGGVASALNAGIAASSGDYISWLSHDDRYHPGKIDSQLAFLQQIGHLAVCYGDFEQIDSEGRLISEQLVPSIAPEALRPSLMICAYLHGCTLLVPRSAYERVGLFSESLRTTQDYDLWFRMAPIIPFYHHRATLVQSRIHSQQGTIVLRDVAVDEVNALYCRYLDQLTPEEIMAFDSSPVDFFQQAATSMKERGYIIASNLAQSLADQYASFVLRSLRRLSRKIVSFRKMRA